MVLMVHQDAHRIKTNQVVVLACTFVVLKKYNKIKSGMDFTILVFPLLQLQAGVGVASCSTFVSWVQGLSSLGILFTYAGL